MNPFSEKFVLNGVLFFLGDIIDYLNPTSEEFILKGVLTLFSDVSDYLNPFSENFILKGVLTSFSSVLDYLNPFSDNFILRGVITSLSKVLDYINPFSEKFLGKKLMELLGDLLENVFVPKEESILNLQNVFSEKLGFIDSIKASINSIKNMFENVNNLPKYSMNIESEYYSGELTIIDLSWYAPYKTYGDLVITGFIYLFFIWRLWCRLPNILHGVGPTGEIINLINNKEIK